MRSLLLKIILFNVTFITALKATASPSQDNVKTIRDSVESTIANIKSNNNWLDIITDGRPVMGPFGMRKVINGTTYEMAFANVDVTNSKAQTRVFAKISLPQYDANGNAKALYFAGFASLTRSGGVVSDGVIPMIGNDTTYSNEQYSLVLNGLITGSSTNPSQPTSFKFNCNGYQSMEVNGNIVLSNKNYIPIDTTTYLSLNNGTSITGSFVKAIPIWDSLQVSNISFNGIFAIPNIAQYGFKIKSASFDFNDNNNPSSGVDFTAYINKTQKVLPKTWRGISISNLEVSLPGWFKHKNSTRRIKVNSNYAVLDENGFSGKVMTTNLIDVSKGDANGWDIGVDSLFANFDNSTISTGRFIGKLKMPFENNALLNSGVNFVGKMIGNSYNFSFEKKSSFKAEIWKVYLELDNSTTISIDIRDGKFYPQIVMSGKMSLHTNGEKTDSIPTNIDESTAQSGRTIYAISDISFEELKFQTVAPYLSIKSFSAGSELNVLGFGASVNINYGNDLKPSDAVDGFNYAGIHFFGQAMIMGSKIQGDLDMALFAEYDKSKNKWAYHSIELNSMAVEGNFGKMSFTGILEIFRKDSVYGNGFSGAAKLKVNDIEMVATLMMGTTRDSTSSSRYQYWTVDAAVHGLKINLDGVIIDGFSGGATYHMDFIEKENKHFRTGVTYTPNSNSFLRLRAGVFIHILNEVVFSGWAGLEYTFTNSWGINKISFSGVGRFLTLDDQLQKNKLMGPNAIGKKQSLEADPVLPTLEQPKYTFGWGDFYILSDFDNECFSLKSNIYANFLNVIKGSGANYSVGKLDIYFSKKNWHINLGTQAAPNGISLNLGFLNQNVQSYFQLGNDITKANADFALKYGFGFKFNAGYSGGWSYANIDGGVSLDAIIVHGNNLQCDGGQAGIYGWYGAGTLRANLHAEAGVSIDYDLWFTSGTIREKVLDASVGLDLTIKGPKPFYASGNMNVNYSVGCCRIFECSGSFNASFSAGTNCNF